MFSFVKFSLSIMLVKVTIDLEACHSRGTGEAGRSTGIHPWQDKERKVGHKDKDQTTVEAMVKELLLALA
jgi:hypothetical protein